MDPRPDVVVVLVDDLRWDELGFAGHPFASTPNIDRIATEGARFTNAFAATPLCSPSRASFLTGRYMHNHGITDNTDRSAQSHRLATFPRDLQHAGYETAFVGKWHMGNDDSPRPGFDHWVALAGQGKSFDPPLNIDGRRVPGQGYVTDVLTDHAVEFVARERSRPFLLYLAHKALHPETVQFADGSTSDPTASNFIPSPRHAKLYEGVTIPRRPSAFKEPRGKRALLRELQGLPQLGPATATPDTSILGRQRMLKAVDESLGRLLQALQEAGRLDRTLVVVTSDHGYFYGEHGLDVERRLAYEESARIPLVMRYPPLVTAGTTVDRLALSIDLAPTVLELARIAPPAALDGRSLVPLLHRTGKMVAWRTSFLIEYDSDTVFPRIHRMGYRAVRTERHKYIHYLDLEGMDELYDLESDPYEMDNIVADPSTAGTLQSLERELARLLDGGR